MISESTTPKKARDSARTPAYVFDYAKWAFGNFDVDLASDGTNSLCTNYVSDSLNADWHKLGKQGWCNPPYSDIRPWIEKADLEAVNGFTTVFLIPIFNGERWGEYVWTVAKEIIILTPRVNFLRPDGTEMKGNPRGSMLVKVSNTDSDPDVAFCNLRIAKKRCRNA